MGSEWVSEGDRGLWKHEGTPWLFARHGESYFEAFLPGVTQPASHVLGMEDCARQAGENDGEKNAPEVTPGIGPEAFVGTSTMQGIREQQEDRFAVVADGFLPLADVRSSAVLVADGHVGATAAEFVADRLPTELRQRIQKLLAMAPVPKKRRLPRPSSNRKLVKREHPEERHQTPDIGTPDKLQESPVTTGSCPTAASDDATLTPADENCLPTAGQTAGDEDKVEDETNGAESAREGIGEGLRDGLQADAYSSDGLSGVTDIMNKLGACMKDCYLKVDAEFLRLFRTSKAGATCATAVILGDILVVANVGDTRVVRVRQERSGNLEVQRLSVDHKPGNETEKNRIEEAGGIVKSVRGCSRVFPIPRSVGQPARLDRGAVALAVSRAFGDRPLKAGDLVVAEPDVAVSRLSPDDRCLIIASDGIWDVLTEEAAASVVSQWYEARDADTAAKTLVRLAYQNGSQVSTRGGRALPDSTEGGDTRVTSITKHAVHT